MSENKIDIQCRKIDKGIRQLLHLMATPLIEHALELHTSSKSSENFKLLTRLERSLDQYIKRDKNLFYIGFLGHYSSGKSATINSVLNLRGTPAERKEAHNPTDDRITLITSLKNNDDVIKSVRAGSIPVIVSPIDGNAFLDDKVVIDSPGSGDPQIIEEIVRDSLPLCDLIIYCISAATPLSSADIPLLSEKEKNLHEIPTLFVITRGDEFKIEPLKSISIKNFNYEKSQEFLVSLASRMKSILPSLEVSLDDFILIDNRDSFNINEIIKYITDKSNPENIDNIIKLHSHKINFFIRITTGIKKFFLNIIIDKLSTIEEFVTQAQKNIDEYDEKTKISTDNLNSALLDREKITFQILNGALSENKKVNDLFYMPAEFMNNSTAQDWKKEMIQRIENLYIEDLSKTEKRTSNILYDVKENLKQELYRISSQQTHINKTQFEDTYNQLTTSIFFTINLEFQFQNFYNSFFLKFKSLLEQEKDSIIKSAESVSTRLRVKSPLDAIQKNILDADKSLSSIFQGYAYALRMYRVAAFANETKNFIRKLGLSEQFDALDSTNISIEESKTSAFKEIFKSYEVFKEEFKAESFNLESRINALRISLLPFNVNDSEQKIIELQKKLLTEFQETLNNSLETALSKMKSFFLDKIDVIQGEILEKEIMKDEEVEQIYKRRKIFYLTKFIPACIILIITFSMFYILPHYKVFEKLTTGDEWLLGLVVNFTTFLFTAIYARKRDNFPNKIEKANTIFLESKKSIISRVIDDEFYSVQKRNVDEMFTSVKGKFSALANNNVTNILSGEINETLIKNYKHIVESEKQLQNIIASYTELLEKFKRILYAIFNNYKINREVLLKQSIEIKKEAINPSFNLLFDTKNSISQVRDEIENVTFI